MSDTATTEKYIISNENLGNGFDFNDSAKVVPKINSDDQIITVDEDGIKANLELTFNSDDNTLVLKGKGEGEEQQEISSVDLGNLHYESGNGITISDKNEIGIDDDVVVTNKIVDTTFNFGDGGADGDKFGAVKYCKLGRGFLPHSLIKSVSVYSSDSIQSGGEKKLVLWLLDNTNTLDNTHCKFLAVSTNTQTQVVNSYSKWEFNDIEIPYDSYLIIQGVPAAQIPDESWTWSSKGTSFNVLSVKSKKATNGCVIWVNSSFDHEAKCLIDCAVVYPEIESATFAKDVPETYQAECTDTEKTAYKNLDNNVVSYGMIKYYLDKKLNDERLILNGENTNKTISLDNTANYKTLNFNEYKYYEDSVQFILIPAEKLEYCTVCAFTKYAYSTTDKINLVLWMHDTNSNDFNDTTCKFMGYSDYAMAQTASTRTQWQFTGGGSSFGYELPNGYDLIVQGVPESVTPDSTWTWSSKGLAYSTLSILFTDGADEKSCFAKDNGLSYGITNTCNITVYPKTKITVTDSNINFNGSGNVDVSAIDSAYKYSSKGIATVIKNAAVNTAVSEAITKADSKYVPKTTKINDKELTGDIDLTGTDIISNPSVSSKNVSDFTSQVTDTLTTYQSFGSGAADKNYSKCYYAAIPVTGDNLNFENKPIDTITISAADSVSDTGNKKLVIWKIKPVIGDNWTDSDVTFVGVSNDAQKQEANKDTTWHFNNLKFYGGIIVQAVPEDTVVDDTWTFADKKTSYELLSVKAQSTTLTGYIVFSSVILETDCIFNCKIGYFDVGVRTINNKVPFNGNLDLTASDVRAYSTDADDLDFKDHVSIINAIEVKGDNLLITAGKTKISDSYITFDEDTEINNDNHSIRITGTGEVDIQKGKLYIAGDDITYHLSTLDSSVSTNATNINNLTTNINNHLRASNPHNITASTVNAYTKTEADDKFIKSEDTVSIGTDSEIISVIGTPNETGIAIGKKATSTSEGISIGSEASSDNGSIAIGHKASAPSKNSITFATGKNLPSPSGDNTFNIPTPDPDHFYFNAKLPTAEDIESGIETYPKTLQSYIDEVNNVFEYNNKDSFPTTGESGKIYVAKDTNLLYRWDGTVYVEVSPSIKTGTTCGTAYDGACGNSNYCAITDLQSWKNVVLGTNNVQLGTGNRNGSFYTAIGCATTVYSESVSIGQCAVSSDNGVSIGACASAYLCSTCGVSIGYNSYNAGGVAIGYNTSADGGIAIGNNADVKFYGVAIGNGAYTCTGISIGYNAKSYPGSDGYGQISFGVMGDCGTCSFTMDFTDFKNALTNGGSGCGSCDNIVTEYPDCSNITSLKVGSTASVTDSCGSPFQSAVSIGPCSVAYKTSVAIGYCAQSMSDYSYTTCTEYGGVAVGANSSAPFGGVAIGYYACSQSCMGYGSVAIGDKASANGGIAIGRNAAADNDQISFSNGVKQVRITFNDFAALLVANGGTEEDISVS